MTVGSTSIRPILHHGISFPIPTLIVTTLLLLLLGPPASAQNPNPNPNYNSTPFNKTNEQTINKSTGAIIIVLVLAFFFVGFISLYIRHCSQEDEEQTRPDPNGSIFLTRRKRGLDAEAIENLPIFSYAVVKELKIGKYALECAVCLTEFDDDDTLRLLPQCDHVFHPECIDTWLSAHATCPVCRCDLHAPPDHVSLPPPESTEEEEPLREERVRRNASLRLWGRISRSFSTGHVAVKQWENLERFRLRLPEEVRKDVMSGKLQRASSLVILPRTVFGEGSSRGGRFRTFRSDRSVLSLVPAFFSRTLSFSSPRPAGININSSGEGSMRGSNSNPSSSTRLPV